MGKIYVVGFGPGDYTYMTVQAVKAIEAADIVVGYTTYTNILKKQFPDKNYLETPMTKEIERCKKAVEFAADGALVALVSSGDAGVYGMAGILLQVVMSSGKNIPVEIVPGVTAASAGAAALGAPLMHDFAVISLSDLMTPIDIIMKRVECAAAGDFVIALYNPKSKKRTEYLSRACKIIQKYRDKETPAGIVRHAGRPEQSCSLTTLSGLEAAFVDMFCIVIIGNSKTYIRDGRMITPRGYESKEAF